MTEDSTSNYRSYSFGDYTLDVGQRELRQAGVGVEIQPRVFDLLAFLAAHHDRAVDKDELQTAVWPGTVVTETALTRAVMKARKAVGDDATRQAVIKTVHGHGYRFVATLLPTATLAQPAAPEAVPPAPTAGSGQPPSSRAQQAVPGLESRWQGIRRSQVMILVTAAVALVATLAWVWLSSSPPAAAGTRLAVLPLADNTGDAELGWTRLGLMSYVSKLVDTDGKLAVVADGSIISLADSLGWNRGIDEPPAPELIARLREVYGASHILAMELVREGNALRMNFSLLDPAGRISRGTMVGDEGPALALGVVQSLYGSLLGQRRHGPELALASTDPFNNEAFARGMDMSLQGRCAEAVPFFRIIIDKDPGLFAPQFEYAACQRILGNNVDAETLLDALVAEQSQLGASRQLAQVLMTRGVLYNRTGRLDLAAADHRRALALVETVDDPSLKARILQNLSIVHEDRGQFQQAEELLDLAVLAYQEAGRETMPGHLYSGRANLCMDRGELVEAREYLELALQAFREAGDRRNEAMMLNNTGYLLREMGRLQEAEDYHLRALEMRKTIGDRVGVGRVYGQLSALYSALGQYADAAAAAQAALEIAQATGDRLFEGTSLAAWASAEQGLGETSAARQHYLQARDVLADVQDAMRVLQIDILIARLDLEADQFDTAADTGREVLAEARRLALPQPEIEARELLAEVALQRGELAAAITGFTTALEQVRASSWGAREAAITIGLVNAHLQAGDTAAAAPLVGALAGMEPSVSSLRTQARFARARGDVERALSLLRQAKTLAGPGWDAQSEAQLAEYAAKQ